jgi:hypothetical protein
MGYSAFFSPDTGNYPIVCVHEKLTGEPCPSCGMSHSFSLILQGRVDEAIEWNQFSVRVFLFFFLQLFLRLLFSVRYLKEPTVAMRNSIVNTDIIVTLAMFFLAFMPFLRFLVISVSTLF